MGFEDLTGKRFGRLVALYCCDKLMSRRYWMCECQCGNRKPVREDSLKTGRTISCGCAAHDAAAKMAAAQFTTHGMTNTRIYRIWRGMKARCYCKSGSSYGMYGAKGITVCDEWRRSFECFYEWAMANGYADDLSIDRIDGRKGYYPENCRWATSKEQRENQPQVEITFGGITRTLQEWEGITGIKYATLLWRYHQGWKPEQILDKRDFSEDTRFSTDRNTVYQAE
jgi:hypothetical protein